MNWLIIFSLLAHKKACKHLLMMLKRLLRCLSVSIQYYLVSMLSCERRFNTFKFPFKVCEFVWLMSVHSGELKVFKGRTLRFNAPMFSRYTAALNVYFKGLSLWSLLCRYRNCTWIVTNRNFIYIRIFLRRRYCIVQVLLPVREIEKLHRMGSLYTMYRCF